MRTWLSDRAQENLSCLPVTEILALPGVKTAPLPKKGKAVAAADAAAADAAGVVAIGRKALSDRLVVNVLPVRVVLPGRVGMKGRAGPRGQAVQRPPVLRLQNVPPSKWKTTWTTWRK